MNKSTVKEIVVIARKQLSRAELGNTAVLVAYYLLLSIFPMIILIGNIVTWFDINPDMVFSYLDVIVPTQVQSILNPIVESLLTSGSAGILSISIIGLLWGASKGVTHMEYGINKAYGFTDTKSGLRQRIMSAVGLIIALFVAVVLVIVFELGEYLMKKLSPVINIADVIDQVIAYAKWPLTIILLVVFVTAVYVFMPSTRVKMRDAIPGSLVTAIGWLILVASFGLYLDLTAKTLSTYGVLSTFFILMFWINFATMILLAGAIVNASIYEYRYGVPMSSDEKPTEHVSKTEKQSIIKLISSIKEDISSIKNAFKKK